MTEHKIHFSVDMVRAIKAGRKGQTRRLLKYPHHPADVPDAVFKDGLGTGWIAWNGPGPHTQEKTSLLYPAGGGFKCPYGVSGDLLYVREMWRPWLDDKGPDGFSRLIRYMADDELMAVPDEHVDWFEARTKAGWHNRPSIHLPKWASRIWLKVAHIQGEKLQDITTEGAIAEGARFEKFDVGFAYPEKKWSMEYPFPEKHTQCLPTARMAFANHISRLHGGKNWNLKDTSLWVQNPWVWVVSFSVVSTTGKPEGDM